MSGLKIEESIDYQIRYTWHNIAKMYNQIANQYELTQSSGLALISIDDKGGTPATQVAIRMGMEPTSLSRLLRSMEEKKYIYTGKDKEDGRKVLVFLTSLGKKKKRMSKMIVKSFNERILGDISESSADNFFKVMNQVNEHINKYKEEFLKKTV